MFDAIIIGAGAAGLEAARTLRRGGLTTVVLEARPDIGGRVKTEGLRSEIELGAEFLHGEAPLTKHLLDRYGMPYVDLEPRFHVFERERLHPATNYWKILSRALSHLRPTRRDRPFSEFVASANLSGPERLLSAAFIEGFDAAELERIGANALVGMGKTLGDPHARALGRPLRGYAPLLKAMSEEVTDAIHLRTMVTEVAWSRGAVAVRAENLEGKQVFQARTVIVTVPIGVLKAPPRSPGAIRFTPEIPGLAAALKKIEMGQVVRLTLEFAPEAYSLLAAKFPRGFPFISSPSLDFMTWWAGGGDDRHPVITAWSGGNHAMKLSALSRPERIELALGNLARILGVRRSTLVYALRTVHHHDWREDPFARGAYSYPGLDAEGATKTLRRATAKTVYFAGEALETENGGTVEGAIASGRKQARRILTALGSRPVTAPILRASFSPFDLR